MLDFAYDTALDVGKFEHDTWKDILSKLPSENELRWAYNQSKTENSGPSMFLQKNFNPIKFIYQIFQIKKYTVLQMFRQFGGNERGREATPTSISIFDSYDKKTL